MRAGGGAALEKSGKISGECGAEGGWDLIYVNNQSDKVNNLELDVALFQRATPQIMGDKWSSATEGVSPNPVPEVMIAMTAGE